MATKNSDMNDALQQKVKLSIRIKLGVMVIAVVLIAILALSMVMLTQKRDDLYEQTVKTGKVSLNYFTQNARIPLLNDDILSLNSLIKEAKSVEGIMYTAIVDRNGIVKAHTDVDANLLGKQLPEFQHVEGKITEDHLVYFQHTMKDGTKALNLSKEVIFGGKVLGHIHLGVDLEFIEKKISESTTDVIIIGVIALLLGLAVTFFIAGTFTKPIIALKDHAWQMAQGDYDVSIDTSSGDEIGLLAQSFDRMRDSIRRKIDDLKLFNEASQRFVPQQFMELLGKDSIVDVHLGDSVQMEVSVLFSDIRSFTTISEGMSPRENFQFLNSYLAEMNPEIRKYNGFIDKYIGDAIMALFNTKAEDALKGAIGMMEALKRWNDFRARTGRDPINIGIGINTGSLMLGTIGGKNRMEGTVISDAVNLASRVEGMTKMYAAHILITENTYNELENPDEYIIRRADRARVKGKEEPIVVYEICDGDEEDIRDMKKQIIKPFEKALDAYYSKDFKLAKAGFEDCLKVFPEDKVSAIYIDRCDQLLKEDPGSDWDGVVTLKNK